MHALLSACSSPTTYNFRVTSGAVTTTYWTIKACNCCNASNPLLVVLLPLFV